MTDQYLTIEGLAEGSFMEKGSKFLASAYPVTSEAECLNYLQALKKSHPKARHFCTALRLGPDVAIERSNDDGEPAGSAGKPILGQLKKEQLTNVLVVVVRYFGGTKLGIPGLIEAYKLSTANALSHARIIKKTIFSIYQFQINYTTYPSFKNYVLQNQHPILEEAYHEKVHCKIGFQKGSSSTAILGLLKAFSQRDYTTLEEYGRDLEMTINLLKEEYIL